MTAATPLAYCSQNNRPLDSQHQSVDVGGSSATVEAWIDAPVTTGPEGTASPAAAPTLTATVATPRPQPIAAAETMAVPVAAAPTPVATAGAVDVAAQ